MRLTLILGLLLVILAAVLWRLSDIALFHHAGYAHTALAQADGTAADMRRGSIFIADGSGNDFLVATNRRFPTILVTPSAIDAAQRDALATSLASITGQTPEAIRTVLASDVSGTRVLARKLTDAQAAAVEALNAQGIALGAEMDRSYPAGSLAADVIGFYGYGVDGRSGQYGVEAAYEGELSGQSMGTTPGQWDLAGRFGALTGTDTSPDANQPDDLELTIDKNIQSYVEGVLATLLTRYQAASGTIIVQEPATGRLLAIADSPTFDPNTYGATPVAAFQNGAIVPFEPGSSFKPFTMALGLENKKVTPESTYDDVGDVVIDGYTIRNFNEGHFGRVTMTTILEKSINTGVMHVESLIGNDAFLRGITDMGFGQRTGVDLPGESPGAMDNLYTKRRINFMTASFGQGITVTPLQLINGYSAIANGGKLMRPYIVASVRNANGQRITTQPEVVGTPFSAKTAATLRSMLVSVVDKGFDKARIPRYDVAGKTGTAQIASPDGGYLDKQYNHSFVGFAPASNPRFTILIKMEKPQGITFAADSLSPTFKDIALFLLNYLNVPPTR